MKFAERSRLNLSEVNKEILEKWRQLDVFHRSMSEREGCPSFIFYEGPPSANGHPGIHHVMARSLKDTICRYRTMQGYQVKRKAGWDTHGLPVELGVEKDLGITKEDIGKKISIEEYNEHCRRNVMMYTNEWTDLSEKMGYWVDLEHPYITYENKYIETLWWLLKQLYDKDLLYKGYTIQPYSPAAGTGLSSHELNQPGCYRDVKDTTATAIFKAIDTKPEMCNWGTPCFIAWTTTPWTLPSNTALCVGPKIDYVCLQTYNPYTAEKISLIMAEALVSAYFKPEGEQAQMDEFKQGDKIVPYRIVGHYKGSDLIGMRYEQLMPWIKPCEKLDANAADYIQEFAKEHPQNIFSVGSDQFVEMSEAAFRVIPGDYVTTDDGTGIVHIALTFGADDQRVGRAAGVPSLFLINKAGETRPMVDLTGKYYLIDELADNFVNACVDKELYANHAGDYVKNAYAPEFNKDGKYDEKAASKAEDLNIVLCMEMKKAGTALRIEKHVHNYPHCWRTDKPVLYYPLDSWFIRSTALKDRMFELNKTINWKPESTGTGRFGNWLENLNDWNLSRSRYWGTPLPVWRNKDTKEQICIGSVEELYNEIEKSVAAGVMKSNPLKDKGFVPGDMSEENYHRIDLHRPYVDNILLVSPQGNVLTRELDLIDVWFDSGSMPYAQIHYPFENKEEFDSGNIYPADFIAEGVDQTRGWFFTLHAIATMVFDSVSFKAVISNGLVLDKNGQKMSKRLGNAIDPFDNIEKYGTDAVRWYMLTNSQPWDNLKYDEAGVQEVGRMFFGKLFECYKFFAMYANVDGFAYKEPDVPFALRPEIDRWILSELNTLVKSVTEGLDDYEPTKAGRLIQTFVLDNLSNWYVRLNRKRFWGGEMDEDKLSAYQTLYTCLETVAKLIAPFAPFFADMLFNDLNSVTARENTDSVHLAAFPKPDGNVDKELELRMEMAQTITSMVLSLRKKEQIVVKQPLQKLAIPTADQQTRERIDQVRQLILDEVNVKELEFVGDGDGLLVKKVKCNFRVMGKKFGKQMKSVSAAVNDMTQQQIAQLEKEGSINLIVDGAEALIEADDVEIISEDMPGWTVANEGALTVALDIDITPELKKEFIAREVIKRIQTIRKESGFNITDRVNVTISDTPEITDAVNNHAEFIASQVLAKGITFGVADGAQEIEIDGVKTLIKVEKA
ncbi:MAG: isoleucine--tRNA ligase [Bacteroidaceae bacterium]|nr:isoleucine--tRNA ligase [Bacteroidaceae bacterium]